MKLAKYRRVLSPEEEKLCNERITQIYDDLHRWIRWLASSLQIQGHWCMSADDIVSEAYWVLVKVTRVYLHKPYAEFKVLCKASIHNAVRSLRYKMAITHRKHELSALSLDEPMFDDASFGSILADYVLTADGVSDCSTAFGMNPEHYVIWAETYLDIVEQLSDFDILVLDACLGFDERVIPYIKLSATRKSFVFSNPTVTITPLIVARALNQSLEAVEESFERLKGLF